MNAKHTPGPWRVLEDTCSACRREGKREFIIVGPPGANHGQFSYEPDARIIAAAPDIYTELIAYHDREWMESHEDLPKHKAGEFPVECGGCAAIARAKGA